MGIEQERGISVTSTVLRFEYRGTVLNLLDTPGHRDFSEDTYRVLTACDAALMVLDAAKGIEEQTRKLLAVCRTRGVPIISFANKVERPGIEPLELIDQIEAEMDMVAAPVTWPVGPSGAFEGLIHRPSGMFTAFMRSARGATEADERTVPWAEADVDPASRATAEDELGLLEAVDAHVEQDAFLDSLVTPVFFGSALANFGVRDVLDALVDLAPAPADWPTAEGARRPVDAPFSGFVFKVQANSDPAHRDRIAYVRVCSGRFARGMPLTPARTGRQVTTRYAHLPFGQERRTMEDAYPGDVVGLVNATELRIGDTLFDGPAVTFPSIPTFAPEHFAVAHNRDSSRYKQFTRGLAQLEEEGVVQVLHRRGRTDPSPVLAAVGPLQFEVALHRLREEFRAQVDLDPPRAGIARRVHEDDARTVERSGVTLLERGDGELLAVFESAPQLQFFTSRNPDVTLQPLGVDGG
jgi:peptide chain release factor 3